MPVNKQLSIFVRDALTNGKSRSEISDVLAQSGWSASEVTEAMTAWAETPFSPPIPRPQATVSAKDFFIYTLTFGVLIFGAFYLVQLIHIFIDLATEGGGYRLTARIRFAMAVLIVTVPVYLLLAIRERKRVRQDPAVYRSAIRKWLIYITLLIAASIMLGDLVAVIYSFLGGDFTVQFLAKAAVVATVAGGIFLFYFNDVRKGETS